MKSFAALFDPGQQDPKNRKEQIVTSQSWRLGACALAAGMLAASLGAQGFSSAHWKSKSEMAGGPQGEMTTESELWTKDKKVRVKTKAMGMNINIVKAGDFLYQWQEGETSGMKMSANMRRRPGASTDYLEKVEEIRTKGKKVGTETVDGHACDIYEYAETRRSEEHTSELQ